MRVVADTNQVLNRDFSLDTRPMLLPPSLYQPCDEKVISQDLTPSSGHDAFPHPWYKTAGFRPAGGVGAYGAVTPQGVYCTERRLSPGGEAPYVASFSREPISIVIASTPMNTQSPTVRGSSNGFGNPVCCAALPAAWTVLATKLAREFSAVAGPSFCVAVVARSMPIPVTAPTAAI